jgi:site-specific recombinase XerC
MLDRAQNPSFAKLLQQFFVDYLGQQKAVSRHTIAAYRDTLSIPRACGHRFHEHVAIDSTNMWPLVPRHVATPLR